MAPDPERRQKIKDIASTLEPVLEQAGCDFAYVAGSWSQGIEMPWSDIDIFIFKENNQTMQPAQRFKWLVDIGMKMEIKTKCPNLDVRDLGDLPPHVQFSIISTGQVIYCKNLDVLYNFKERTMKTHYDLAPWRNRLLEASIKNMAIHDGHR